MDNALPRKTLTRRNPRYIPHRVLNRTIAYATTRRREIGVEYTRSAPAYPSAPVPSGGGRGLIAA
jgi:hypothetical protein